MSIGNSTSLTERTPAPIMLVVGGQRNATRTGPMPPQIDGFHFAGFQDVTPELLAECNPDVVLSALMADRFDALDLARRLADAGYRGRYRAMTLALPNPDAVLAEVKAMAPEIDFELFVIDGLTKGLGGV